MFPDEQACGAYLERVRWPDGFACHCGAVGEAYRFENRPTVLRCRKCQRNTYLTAGTVMHATRTPLQAWFWGAYLVTTQTPGMSALQFQRQLGIRRYETAFRLLHKLRASMVRPDRDRIGGKRPVEADETLVGGKTRGEGHGVHHMTYVVGAVEVRTKLDRRGRRSTYAGRLRLHAVPDRSAKSLEGFVLDSVQPGTHITTDDWSGYDHLAEKGFRLTQVAQRGDPDVTKTHLPLIHLVFSNLKAWLRGTHHGVSRQYLPAYLNEYVFRFNRRFYPMTAFASVLGIGTRAGGPTSRGNHPAAPAKV